MIFHDPTRQRQRVTRAIAAVLALLTLAILAVFVMTLVDAPVLPIIAMRSHLHRARVVARHHVAYRNARRRLFREIAREHATARTSNGIAAAFYAPWQETGLHSLEANAGRLTHLMPAWLRVSADGTSLDYTDWNPTLAYHNLDVVRIAREHEVKIVPVLANAVEGEFQSDRAHALLTNHSSRTRVIMQLRAWLLENRFAGVNLDFENLTPEDARLFPSFVAEVANALHPAGLLVTADLEAGLATPLWDDVAKHCDFAIVMGYDQHSAGGAPGPIASLRWFRKVLDDGLANVPREKLVIGLGNYGYDWTENEGAEPLSYEQTLMRARDVFGDDDAPLAIDFDPTDLNPTFNYKDDDGAAHEVWLLDGVTAANQWRLASTHGVRGIALWALGLEDPSVWQFIDRIAKPAPRVDRLANITFPNAVEFIGDGEILQVAATPTAGHRTIEVDAATGLGIDETYERFPTPFVIRRGGYTPKTIALTIDDGPAEPYTSEILDLLKKYNVKATFFVIGENLERHPELARRIVDEGSEIGSHTYTHTNMAAVSPLRATLELNATQRAIESVTGRSTVLFRPPYNADAEPTTREEIVPVTRAAELGYVTVGEYIDPLDWEKKNGADIERAVLTNLRNERGNCVLLHDGGGDRNATVQALAMLIPELKRQGYRFATVSQLMHTTRDAVMPPVGATDRFFLDDDEIVFGATSRTEAILATTFIAAIFLGIARILILVALALRKRTRTFDDTFAPTVSVIIAAYNEEAVIAKTIASIQKSTYEPIEIIVVDDGSTDRTQDILRQLATDNRQRIFSQPNSGKAAALNHAIRHARGDVLVCIDADTVLHADAIRFLVRHFADARVGAVAGNVKVGNRGRLATKLQSIEYITSQNLDRRAWESLDAVTVVPGAIGAWRREAVADAGGFRDDTMAEDMDLTWRLRRAGWRIECDNDAISYTEAPETIGALFRQRFRWAFGTLQCLWKHRSALGRHEWFGRAMLPSLWIFQIAFQLLSPIVDLQIALTAFEPGVSWGFVGGMFALFTAIDLAASAVAHRIERESMKALPLLVVQRFFYRQLMYVAIVKSLTSAVQGLRTGWNKLERLGTVPS